MSNSFTIIKDIFIEDNGVFDYINLDKSAMAYHKIMNALQKPLKLVLFYGRPGSGKTFLLNKIYKDLSSKQRIVFFNQPFFNENAFVNSLYHEIFWEEKKLDTYENFIAEYKKNFKIKDDNSNVLEHQTIILLDEAQLYPDELIEKIRLMADTRCFKFLFTVHKTDEEDVLVKDYFKTRIWESVELTNSNLDEVGLYIGKKLAYHNFQSYFSMYGTEQIKLLYKFTNGNLRTLNKMMYKVYELLEYYEENRPTAFNSKRAFNKIIEMAAIDSELLNA